MQYRIYQVDLDRDDKRVAFEGLELLEKFQGSKDVDASIYDLVYSGVTDGSSNLNALDSLYQTFNINHPADYFFRSMSVSDVIEIANPNGSEFFFCDNFGFERISFDAAKARNLFMHTVRGVVCKPGMRAVLADVPLEDELLRRIIGKDIKTYNPYHDGTVIVYNDAAKLRGWPVSREVRSPLDESVLYDTIAGQFVILGLAGDGSFRSLTDDEEKTYMERFAAPYQN
ncbi:MAG: DUF3846 domain-containing protein [Ruminococcaceae bacterium]|nr:DUF3846 domain-containing protein [Oscillospiraceae bacterium]